jgi:cytochrome c oxidase subunit 3
MPAELLQKTAPGLSGPRGPSGDDRPHGGEGPPAGPAFGPPARFGLWAFMGTVTMLFVGFTSAYLVRRASPDWRPLDPPPLLWLNTAVLLASSVLLERARGRLRAWAPGEALRWLSGAGLLGLLFLAGQVGAWRQLSGQGVFLASSPHSSFFYLLSGVHGAHLLGGLGWFASALLGLRGLALTPGEDGLGLLATYWHFLALVWVYLLLLLFLV